ncbi:glucosaminidase domain-containing protein [uncultured Polaribacter sp.]|uniref:glucosaminidase domain-containing protein n=1 Tax=uncultured Polaribacter sp. TaxID=174711 RepID=UPI002639D2FD|nr:glucosaminidase domain-containing protein [uncultured Polaribacter sp.]
MKLRIVFYVCLCFLASCNSPKKAVFNKKKPVKASTEKVVQKVTQKQPKKQPKQVVKQVNKKVSSEKKVTKITKKIANKNPNLNGVTLAYIKNYASIAVSEMHKSRIPASITLAQGILESGNGRSELASKSNNHFGIKCHSQWQGDRVYHDDDTAGECFRKYKYVKSSYRDHSAFLTDRSRYAFLFNYKITDYKSWARGLKKAGYASDKNYPNKLINLIEKYSLYEFDKGAGTSKTLPSKTVVANYYKVKQGDTLYSIARLFGTSVARIKALNNLGNSQISIGQDLLVEE